MLENFTVTYRMNGRYYVEWSRDLSTAYVRTKNGTTLSDRSFKPVGGSAVEDIALMDDILSWGRKEILAYHGV